MRNRLIVLLAFLIACNCAAQEFRQALPGYRFEFPRDFFSHPDYQTEWWYYTGNLKAADGRRFGYELTFFRQGVSRASNSSPWFVNDVWMAHLTISDIAGGKFLQAERLNRSGPGLAGVDETKGVVWNGNWQAKISQSNQELRAIADAIGLDLHLTPEKPPVIQGQNGISQKAEGVGHASHYFSQTRLRTTGTIWAGGKAFTVEGASWMDHEFFTGSMAASERGWDWLSVQFEDGSELMLYRLRHNDGNIDSYSSGSFVDSNGKSMFLGLGDFTMNPDQDTWTSAKTKAAYPVKWRITIPRLQLDLAVSTPLQSQEVSGSFGPVYWEGAIDVQGKRGDSPLKGVGYLEMTGYAPGSQPVIPR